MPGDYENDYERGRLAVLKACVARVAASSPHATAIELGCGTGVITEMLVERCARVVSVDLDGEVLARARAACPSERVEWLAHDLNRPLPPRLEGQCEVAVALEIIEHLYRPEAFVRDLRRVLKVGGTLLLSTPNLTSPEALVGWFWSWRAGKPYRAWDESHRTLFPARALLRLLEAEGFALERVVGYHYGTPTLPILGRPLRPPFRSSARYPLNRLGFNLIAHASAIRAH